MRIGALNRRVLLQRRVETPSGTGGSTVTWQDIGQVWANIKHQSGAEVMRSGVPVSVRKASIRTWFREDIDATCRALIGSTVYDIKGVLPSGREFIDMVAETGENDG